MITPTVNLNGTSGKELFQLNLAVVEHLQDTINALSKAYPNARDYQTAPMGDHQKAVKEHEKRMQHLQYVYSEMQTILEAMGDYA